MSNLMIERQNQRTPPMLQEMNTREEAQSKKTKEAQHASSLHNFYQNRIKHEVVQKEDP